MKHFYTKVLLTAIGLFITMQVNGATEVTIGQLKYTLNGTEASVSGYVEGITDLVVPETIEVDGITFRVTAIANGAFQKCLSLTSISAPSIKVIGKDAFGASYNDSYSCKNLREISFPNVEEINANAFNSCTSLKKAYLGSKLHNLGYYAFRDCSSLVYIVFPQTLSSISHDTFYGCNMLQTIIYTGKSFGKCFSNANVYSPNDFVTWSASNFDYNGHQPVVTFTNNLTNGFAPKNYNLSKLKVNAGNYTDSISFTFANEDMNFEAKIPYSYVIKKLPLMAKVENTTREYGEENPIFHTSYSGFVNSEGPEVLLTPGNFTTEANKRSNVGEYPVKFSGATATNYTIAPTEATLTITKASLIAQPNNVEKVYGQDNPSFSIRYTGLKNGENAPAWEVSPTVSTTATKQSSAGTYPIVLNTGVPKNYNMETREGTLTINKANLTITADNKNRKYFEENPTLTCRYEGFVNGEDSHVLTQQPTLSTNAVKKSSVGTYAIEVTGAVADNYKITQAAGILTIDKRMLNVSTDNYTRSYNEPNPDIKLIYNGFVNNEDEQVIKTKPTVTVGADQKTDVGSYNININGGLADNYDFHYNGGVLTINKAYQTLVWEQELTQLVKFDQVELTAKASSELPVTYMLGYNSFCSLSQIGDKTYLDCAKEGETTIYAIQQGNNNYYPTTKIYKNIAISATSGIENIAKDNSSYTFSNGKLLLSEQVAANGVAIYTLDGRKIYQGNETKIPLQKGVYILKMNKRTKKVYIK